MNKTIIFSSQSYEYLCDEICRTGEFVKGEVEINEFPDAERYLRIGTDVSGKDAVVVGGTISDSDTLEVYDVASTLVDWGIRSLTLIVPYFGYSTMERAIRKGEAVTAKIRARIISSLPMSAESNRVVLIDIHSEGIPHYFEGSLRPFHLYSKDVIKGAITELGGDDFVLACTDAGRAKWVESLANEIKVNAAFVLKKRISANETEVTTVSACVKNKLVVIYDDMIRSGSSLINAASAYIEAGAKAVNAVATHGVFPGNALKKIRDSGVIKKLTTTNSHPRAVELQDGFLSIASIEPILTSFIKKNYTR